MLRVMPGNAVASAAPAFGVLAPGFGVAVGPPPPPHAASSSTRCSTLHRRFIPKRTTDRIAGVPSLLMLSATFPHHPVFPPMPRWAGRDRDIKGTPHRARQFHCPSLVVHRTLHAACCTRWEM